MEKALSLVREIQKANPAAHVGGSVGLFLHGINLKRFQKWKGDIDISCPDKLNLSADFDKQKVSFDDFDTRYRKSDIGIDVSEHNDITPVKITHGDYDYLVTPIEVILFFKCSYAMKGVNKHLLDIYEMFGKEYAAPELDLPF